MARKTSDPRLVQMLDQEARALARVSRLQARLRRVFRAWEREEARLRRLRGRIASRRLAITTPTSP